jgi:Fe2+ transport system protein FeoA
VTPVPLSELPPGRAGRVVRVPDDGGHRAVRLAALGLVAGARLTAVQQHPATIVRVGGTTLALESDVAARILVEAED